MNLFMQPNESLLEHKHQCDLLMISVQQDNIVQPPQEHFNQFKYHEKVLYILFIYFFFGTFGSMVRRQVPLENANECLSMKLISRRKLLNILLVAELTADLKG